MIERPPSRWLSWFAAPPSTRASAGNTTLAFLLALVIGVVVGGAVVYLFVPLRHGAGASEAAAEKKLFQCPMHPAITADHPSDCPICGMKLVEVAQTPAPATANALPTLTTVTIDPARQQLIGLATAKVVRGPLAAELKTVARLQVDPTRVRKINVKVEGYIERLFVDFVGRPVRQGEPLFSLYSPSLLAAEQEYLLALQTASALAGSGDSATRLVEAARRKLELWDVPEREIARLEQTRTPEKALTFVSPIKGVVTAKSIVAGARLNPGDMPYEITDLSMVWALADAYETDLGRVAVGQPAELTVVAYPNERFSGKIAFIEPLLDAATRTVKLHVHLPNPEGRLKPEMYGEVRITTAAREALLIPVDAVLRAGDRDVVFVALADGKFEPRAVALGEKNAEQVEVRSGLSADEAVVTRANFLIDSESQLRASLSALGGH